jgi:magnesium transporter
VENKELKEHIFTYIKDRQLRELREMLLPLEPPDIAELIADLPTENSIIVFRILPKDIATEIFEYLPTDTQASLLNSLGSRRVAVLLNEMAVDDRTALLEEFPAAAVKQLLLLLSKEERQIALSLLGYPDGSVGRLMTTDYLAINPDWNVSTTLMYIRENGQDSDSLNVLYVLDEKGKLVDEVRVRSLLLADPKSLINDIADGVSHSLKAYDEQEEAVKLFRKYGRTMLPVVDSNNTMLGIVTIDDVLEIAEEVATEDIQKFGGSEVLEDPYLRAPFLSLVKSRATWLIVLFLGEMLTATAMAFFEYEIARAVVLTLFVPLIISSGGNSGSQAATLVIRSLATGEIKIQDWLKVFRREFISGLILGNLLGFIGFMRVFIWNSITNTYGTHWLMIGTTVYITLTLVVLTGTIVGSMFPLILKKIGADPATSSAPFVATIVDVVGIIVYFTLASLLLKELLR